MFTSIKARSAQITKLVDSLPVPDSVKSFVHDPKSVLPKSAQDLIDTAQSSFGQQGEPADLENAEAPKAPVVAQTPKSILKKDSRVTIAPTPTFSDEVVLDGGIQLTNRQPRTPTRSTTTDDTYNDVYNNDNADNASNFVRNPDSVRSQGRLPIVKPTVPPLPEGCKCEACLAAKAAHAPPPPSVSTADVMKQLEDLKKFMVEQMKPQPLPPTPVAPAPVAEVAPVPVHVSASEPAERLPKIVYPENSRSHASPIAGKTEPVVEVPAAPVAEAPVTETKVAETPEVKVAETTEAPVTETQDPPKATIEVNAHELEEIRAILAERKKDYQVS
jgi:hypothetical protein